MAEIAFYHCTTTSVPVALVTLLQKILSRQERVLLLVPDEARLAFYDDYLWTYAADSFLPHGSKKDGFAADQPIWLSIDDYPANNASYAILLEGTLLVDPSKYQRTIHLFDGTNEAEVQAARDVWRDYKQQQHNLIYYAQGPDASWQIRQ